MKAIRHIVLALVAVLCLSGCEMSKIKDIRLSSLGVGYVVPTSSRSLEGNLLVGIDNPAMALCVNEVYGTINYYGKSVAHFTADPVELEAHCDKVYTVHCTVTLTQEASLRDLATIARARSLDGLSSDVDLDVSIMKSGHNRTVSFRDVDLSRFNMQ